MSLAADKLAVVLLSGGLDSATVLAKAVADGYACHALSFDYGQRHLAELSAAARVARSQGVVTHRVVKLDLAQFGGSALTDASIAVPTEADKGHPPGADKGHPLETDKGHLPGRADKGHPPDEGHPQDIPVTYVPARNTVFLSFALAWCEVLGADAIFIGVNAVDYSGYPDCRPAFIAAFQKMARLATRAGVEGSQITIHTPLIDLSKAEIIQLGQSLGVDYATTVSCYQADEEGLACGECDACRLRRLGFDAAGEVDPTRYKA